MQVSWVNCETGLQMCSVLQEQKSCETEVADGKQGQEEEKNPSLTTVFPYSLALLLMRHTLKLGGLKRFFFNFFFFTSYE